MWRCKCKDCGQQFLWLPAMGVKNWCPKCQSKNVEKIEEIESQKFEDWEKTHNLDGTKKKRSWLAKIFNKIRH